MKKSYSSDIMINWNDMRTQFGYNLLYDMPSNNKLGSHVARAESTAQGPMLSAIYVSLTPGDK